MMQSVLHVLLDCFVNLSDRMEKYASTVGHCVAVIMAVFELMSPKHYNVLRNSLLQGMVQNINLEVRGEGGRERMEGRGGRGDGGGRVRGGREVRREVVRHGSIERKRAGERVGEIGERGKGFSWW